MQPVYVKKQGRVATVYIDLATNQPCPLANFDDEPVGGFPNTVTTDQIAGMFPGRPIVWVEQPRDPQPESISISDAQVAEFVKGATAETKPHGTVALVPDPSQLLLDKALAAFKDLITAWKLGGDMEAKRDAEAVMMFLAGIEPALEEPLRALAAAEPAAKRRVTL